MEKNDGYSHVALPYDLIERLKNITNWDEWASPWTYAEEQIWWLVIPRKFAVSTRWRWWCIEFIYGLRKNQRALWNPKLEQYNICIFLWWFQIFGNKWEKFSHECCFFRIILFIALSYSLTLSYIFWCFRFSGVVPCLVYINIDSCYCCEIIQALVSQWIFTLYQKQGTF